jgi:RIO kinase 1
MQVLTTMRLMYQKAKLVHADLSEWNLLYHKDLVYLIDTAQAVESEHPNALLFLRRDCHNMATFFRRRGVKNGLTTRQIFGFVTETSAALGQEFDANQWDSHIVQLRKENSGKTQQDLSNEDQIAESVFMNSFIPRTLRQVPNPLEEIEQMQAGADVSALLHATVTGVGIDGFFKPDGSYAMNDEEADAEEESEEGEESAEDSKSGSDDDLSSTPTKKNELRPRKSLTKEERKQQRREVKAKRREARQNRSK